MSNKNPSDLNASENISKILGIKSTEEKQKEIIKQRNHEMSDFLEQFK